MCGCGRGSWQKVERHPKIAGTVLDKWMNFARDQLYLSDAVSEPGNGMFSDRVTIRGMRSWEDDGTVL
jgi:hypothetical protein